MRTRSAGSAVPLLRGAIVAGLLTGLLAGCAAMPTPAPSPSATVPAAAPLFASDAEALAAAEAAYAAYQDMSNQIARDGGQDVERLAPLVTEAFFPIATAGFEQFREEGWRGDGGMRFDTIKLQQRGEQGGRASVAVYLCVDARDARLLGRDAEDVTPKDRRERTPLVISLISDEPSGPALLVDSSKVWSGDDFC